MTVCNRTRTDEGGVETRCFGWEVVLQTDIYRWTAAYFVGESAGPSFAAGEHTCQYINENRVLMLNEAETARRWQAWERRGII